MKKKHRIYFRLNMMSLFLIAVSFISVTLAWFAYSGIATVDTTVDVKAWYIELEKDGQKSTNNIVISLANIYPGMETITEHITIKNLGDSDAELFYKIVSARILGDENNYHIDDTVTSEYVEDILSHDFPFSVNMSISKRYLLSKEEHGEFEISISWPLDSGTDLIDSQWGSNAYNFQLNELEKQKQNPSYQIEPSIKIRIDLTAEQYLGTGSSSDPEYNLGDEMLIDVINQKKCQTVSETCLKMYVIDENNTLSDSKVTLLPNPYRSYLLSDYVNYSNTFNTFTSSWNVFVRSLEASDLLNIISRDVKNSLLIRDGMSDSIIGNLRYGNRMQTVINKDRSLNGYYTFTNQDFSYLTSVSCYWTNTEYNSEYAFALVKENDDTSKIYNNLKNNQCHVIPVVEMSKNNLQ